MLKVDLRYKRYQYLDMPTADFYTSYVYHKTISPGLKFILRPWLKRKFKDWWCKDDCWARSWSNVAVVRDAQCVSLQAELKSEQVGSSWRDWRASDWRSQSDDWIILCQGGRVDLLIQNNVVTDWVVTHWFSLGIASGRMRRGSLASTILSSLDVRISF